MKIEICTAKKVLHTTNYSKLESDKLSLAKKKIAALFANFDFYRKSESLVKTYNSIRKILGS